MRYLLKRVLKKREEAFSQYNEYYTDSERKLVQQIIKSKQAFYDLMDALVKCKEEQ